MARKKRRSKAGRPRGSGTGLSAASIAELQAEIERRESALAELHDRRSQLEAELAEIDREIAQHGGLGARRGPGRPKSKRGPGRPVGSGRKKVTRRRSRTAGGRPRNEMSLVDALQKELTGKTMGVSEVAESVQASGYQTTSANFRTIVNQALITNPRIFRKVSRGQYTAK